jgi:hypothetical protein
LVTTIARRIDPAGGLKLADVSAVLDPVAFAGVEPSIVSVPPDASTSIADTPSPIPPEAAVEPTSVEPGVPVTLVVLYEEYWLLLAASVNVLIRVHNGSIGGEVTTFPSLIAPNTIDPAVVVTIDTLCDEFDLAVAGVPATAALVRTITCKDMPAAVAPDCVAVTVPAKPNTSWASGSVSY